MKLATLQHPSSVPASDSTLALTQEQRRQFDEDGFILLEDALTPAEIDELIDVVDTDYAEQKRIRGLGPHDPFQMRNIIAYDRYRKLMDHPRILPLVVDVIGYNIHVRTSHMDVRPPMREEDSQAPLGARGSFFPWHSDGPNFGWPTVDGVIPFMEVKVAYYLTDLSEQNSGAICVVRGSHRTPQPRDANGNAIVDPADIVEVNVRPGTAMLWRTALLHAVTPNLSDHARKCLYYGYTHRWVRPSDYDHQSAEALAGCNPVQLQLLGELGTGLTNYVGDDPLIHPVSRYWRPQDEDIPLKTWAEAQRENGHN